MLDSLNKLESEARLEILSVQNNDSLESWRIAFLGSKGKLKGVMPLLKDVPKEEKPAVGKRLNEVKVALESAFDERKQSLKGNVQSQPPIDVTEPGDAVRLGRRHIISYIEYFRVDIFVHEYFINYLCNIFYMNSGKIMVFFSNIYFGTLLKSFYCIQFF